MKRKNLVAMGLAGIMAVGMCMPVCAAESTTEINQESNSKSVTAQMNVTVDDKYAVTIPSVIEYTYGENTKKELTFSITEAPIVSVGKAVTVSVTNPTVTLTTGADASKVTYEMSLSTDGTTELTAKTALASFDKDSSANATKTAYVINKSGVKPTNSGIYKGSIQFDIAVE